MAILRVLLYLLQHQHAGTEASNILGDKLQQKMDAITFTQERMKRQLDDLEGKTSVSLVEHDATIT